MRPLLLLGLTCLVMPACAAASRVLVPDDCNLGISVQDVHSDDDGAHLVYYTFPVRGQPHAAQPCTLNLYQLPLATAPEPLMPRPLAQNYCGSRDLAATFLDSCDVRVVSSGRVDVLRPGKGTVARHGDIVVVATVGARERTHYPTAAAIAVGLTATGKVRWRTELDAASIRLTVMQTVATRAAGALVRALPDGAVALPGQTAAGALVTDEVRMYRIGPSGELR